MKTNKYIVISLVCSLIFCGCSDYLEENNKGGITNDDFYKTATGYETLMTASYSTLRTVYGTLTPWVLCAGTDIYQRSRGTGDRAIQEYEQLYASEGCVKDFYKNCYDAIQATNVGLFYNEYPDISETLKAQYKAELRFLRAFYHFALIEQFGGICINEEPTFGPRTNIPRSTLQQSYDFVMKEMEESLPNLSTTETRVNKTTANHYLAKVYVTRAWDLKQSTDFEKAKTYASAAIGGKNISIPFETLWSPTNENNDEFILSVQYDTKSIANTTSGNIQQSLFGPYLGGSELNHKYMTTVLYPSWNLHNFYAENDARYDATFMLTIYDQYFDYYDSGKDKSNMLIRAFYPRVWGREYTSADSLAWAQQHPGQIASNFRYYPFKYSEEAYRAAYETDMCTPVIKKFDSPQSKAIWSTTASVRDVVLARLAETYFLYAEACIGLNDFTTAAQYVQKVLDRPGNSKDGTALKTTIEIASATNQSDALNAYLIESAKEFAGEYLRWTELRRTGKLKEFCGQYNYDIKKIGVNVAFKGLDNQDKILRPIPQDAIDLNDALSDADQNPGYVAK